jgi:hypothetical protein
MRMLLHVLLSDLKAHYLVYKQKNTHNVLKFSPFALSFLRWPQLLVLLHSGAN